MTCSSRVPSLDHRSHSCWRSYLGQKRLSDRPLSLSKPPVCAFGCIRGILMNRIFILQPHKHLLCSQLPGSASNRV